MDILIFVNTVVNYLILLTAQRLMKKDARLWRLILASFAGALFSMAVFIDIRSFFFSLLLKAVSTLAISMIAFRFHSFKELLKQALLTFSVSAGFSGLMTAIYQVFQPSNMLIINDVVYFDFDPLLLIALTCVIYGAVYLIERLLRERLRASIVRLSFTVNGTAYRCIGKIDTGCSLTEPFSGAPVIIADETIMKIPDDAERRIIPYHSLGASSVLFAVRAASIEIEGKPIDKTVYIASGHIRDSACQAIIHSDIIR